jgi:hypothetical protein
MKTRQFVAIALAAASLGAAVSVSAQDNRGPYNNNGYNNGSNNGQGRESQAQYRRVYDHHGHYRCERARRNATTRDTVIGAVGGGLLGGAIGGHAGGVLLGAGAGALAGNAVGRSQVRC